MNVKFQPYPVRAYVVLAVNENDSSDVWGYCEESFSMGWYRHRVNIYITHTANYLKKLEDRNTRTHMKYGNMSEEKARAKAKKENQTTNSNQECWNFCKRVNCPVGYKLKVFRLGSKDCPIVVDFRYRNDYNSKRGNPLLGWHKFRYRNPPFLFKADVESGKYWFPKDYRGWLKMNLIRYDGKIKVKSEKKYSLKAMRRARRQRENSFKPDAEVEATCTA